ncbi:DUF5133 domain-containing protein [Streptomyces sp. NPDC087440]|uniref:DUF5133 domain-containing protein n=1 Tax=Streptomyces sp. NPDC087440 TaxID=3365790 RepID=UPI0037FE9699
MITPHPQVLRDLLSRYATARLAHEEHPGDRTRRVLEDVSYTLCVTTATTDVPHALAAAEILLGGAASPVREPAGEPAREAEALAAA